MHCCSWDGKTLDHQDSARSGGSVGVPERSGDLLEELSNPLRNGGISVFNRDVLSANFKDLAIL